LDIFGYWSVSGLRSFPPLATRLLGFRQSLSRPKSEKKKCQFEFRLMFRQGPVPVLQIGYIIIGNSNLYKDEGTVFNPESVVDTMKTFHNMKMFKMLYI